MSWRDIGNTISSPPEIRHVLLGVHAAEHQYVMLQLLELVGGQRPELPRDFAVASRKRQHGAALDDQDALLAPLGNVYGVSDK